jgi:TPP-dependent pyruvate/acetoin dehydrogenase alpha subunit
VGVTRKEDLKEWMKKDPIARLKEHLARRGVRPADFDEIVRQVRAEVEESVRFARASAYPSAEELTDHVFKEAEN